jgi:universal stress protein E
VLCLSYGAVLEQFAFQAKFIADMTRHKSCIDVYMNINKLLLELDPRKDNAAAVSRALNIATRFNASVDVLVIMQRPVIPTAVIAEPAAIMTAEQEYGVEIDSWVDSQLADLAAAKVDFSVTKSDLQPRYETVLKQADASGADLIIRISGEHGRLKRLFVGTTDWDLIRHAKQPLWLVPSDGRDISGADVMAAVDPMHPEDEHMALDKRILGFANDLAKALDGSLHVFHAFQLNPLVIPAPTGAVMTPPTVQADAGLLEQVESAHKASLDKLLEGHGLEDSRVHMLEGDPATKIDEVIDANKVGVVVAGAISRSWLDRLLIGSTAESLLDAVNCDLVFVKAGS